MEKKLSQLKQGESGCIMGFSKTSDCIQRVQEMGLCVGTHISMIRTAPLGDPSEYEFRGCRLCMREVDAKEIIIS